MKTEVNNSYEENVEVFLLKIASIIFLIISIILILSVAKSFIGFMIDYASKYDHGYLLSKNISFTISSNKVYLIGLMLLLSCIFRFMSYRKYVAEHIDKCIRADKIRTLLSDARLQSVSFLFIGIVGALFEILSKGFK